LFIKVLQDNTSHFLNQHPGKNWLLKMKKMTSIKQFLFFNKQLIYKKV